MLIFDKSKQHPKSLEKTGSNIGEANKITESNIPNKTSYLSDRKLWLNKQNESPILLITHKI